MANNVTGPQNNLNAWSMRKRGLVFLISIIITNKATYLPINANRVKLLPQNKIINNKGIV